jgi:hypothetical protein
MEGYPNKIQARIIQNELKESTKKIAIMAIIDLTISTS